jgi:hypothetical protein
MVRDWAPVSNLGDLFLRHQLAPPIHVDVPSNEFVSKECNFDWLLVHNFFVLSPSRTPAIELSSVLCFAKYHQSRCKSHELLTHVAIKSCFSSMSAARSFRVSLFVIYNCSMKGFAIFHSEELISRLLTGVRAIFANNQEQCFNRIGVCPKVILKLSDGCYRNTRRCHDRDKIGVRRFEERVMRAIFFAISQDIGKETRQSFA